MNKTSLKQKLLLIVFGIFLAVILLETGLRAAGAVVLYLQERHNHESFNPNEYRILCLGESTTALGGADSYPSQLERMLNAESRQKRFTVINKGIIATTTDYILAHIEQNLDMYKPQLVVVMMGINDRAFLYDSYKVLWWKHIKLCLEDFRVYKLAHLLYEHVTHRFKEINAFAEIATTNKFFQRFNDHMFSIVQYQKFFRQYPSDSMFSEAWDDILKQDAYNHNYKDVNQHWIEIIKWLRENKHYDLEEFLKSLYNQTYVDWYLNRALDQAYVDLGKKLDLQGQYKQEEAFYLKEIFLHPKNSRLYQAIGEFYQRQGKEDIAQGYFQKVAQLEVAEYYYPATLVNYRLILDKILSRNIKVVVMQYPLRDIKPLKDYLGQRNGVFFVENRQNFKQALIMNGGYWHYFIDNFAYDFGHCTRAGNELIAHNLTEVILKKISVLGW